MTRSASREELEAVAKGIRRLVIEKSFSAGKGHIGSSLSIVEILTALYFSAMKISRPDDPDRDRFVLSKGHAVLSLYGVLRMMDWLPEKALSSYGQDGTLLGGHPDHRLKGIDFSTGSLGHGLSMGAGAALAARLQVSRRRVFVLVSDAECNEGALWESVMFAAHHRLGNLIAIVDLNGQQALGYTRNVIDLEPMADRWASFGWEAQEVDGHDVVSVANAFQRCKEDSTGPHVILARTVSGKGVSFMEKQIKWHYMPLTFEEYRIAIQEIEAEA